MHAKSVDGKQFRFGVIPKMKDGISADGKETNYLFLYRYYDIILI